MFNGLASFFFGAIGGSSSTIDQSSSSSSSTSTSINYTTTETEGGDWLLVDQSGKRRSQGNNNNGCVGGRVVDNNPCTTVAIRSPQSSAPSSPTPGISLLDGSWYMTPPPCFTADSPTNGIETSPLENLLIEHPSMSVYASCTSTSNLTIGNHQPLISVLSTGGKAANGRTGRHRRNPLVRKCGNKQATTTTTMTMTKATQKGDQNELNAECLNDEDVDEIVMQGCQPALVNNHGSKRVASAAAVAAREELLLHVEMQARSQKASRKRETRSVHGRQLERINKVQEYQSLGKRQRRKDFMKNHSGANNNRKC